MAVISYFPRANNLKSFTKYGENIVALDRVDNIAIANTVYIKAICLTTSTAIMSSYFTSATGLLYASLPECVTIYRHAFDYCVRLQKIYLPKCKTISSAAFRSCYSLSSIDLPNCEEIQGYPTYTYGAFHYCDSLSKVSLPKIITLGQNAFADCHSLMKLYLTNSVVCSLVNSNAFRSTPIIDSSFQGAFGSIYVPSSLLASYKTANNWSYFSSRFVGI